MRTLLESGADANFREGAGQTALLLAAQKGHLAIVEMLVTAGAAIDRETNFGETALVAAATMATHTSSKRC